MYICRCLCLYLLWGVNLKNKYIFKAISAGVRCSECFSPGNNEPVFSFAICTEPWTLDNLMWGQEHPQVFLIHCFPVVCEKVTGRKARGLQMEEIACKCQTFLSLLSGRRKQSRDIFSFSIQI